MSFNNLLTVDIGNTKTSFFLRTLQNDVPFKSTELNNIIQTYKLSKSNTKVLISSVKNHIEIIEIKDFESIDLKSLYQNKTFINMPVDYNETIGTDRLICSYFAYQKKKKTIIIDSGTFTTIDVVDSNGFRGGFILAGLDHLKNAYSNGENLKIYSPQISNDLGLANTSVDAINRGLTLSFIAVIEKVISNYLDYDVFLTGGNANIIKSLLKNVDINAEIKLNLIHESMHLIGKELK